MSEEERRRCIILGACPAGAAASVQEARREALRESLRALGEDAGDGEIGDYILGLIDEALNLKHKAKP